MTLQTDPSCLFLRGAIHVLKSPIIIGIAGDSGSGKTLFSDGIRKMLGSEIVKTIEMDGYHKENREQRKISGVLPLDPNANKFDVLVEHLKALKNGESIQIHKYDHVIGDFLPDEEFVPSPIIILEGLHALYPEFLPFLDFTIYADPCRDIKIEWKRERDIKKRGHSVEKLAQEMLQREAAYKRWIDFQKTQADVTIKIFKTQIPKFARYGLVGDLPKKCYKVELIMTPATIPFPSVPLPFDLASFMNPMSPPFLLAAAQCVYWGRSLMDIHIDGMLPQKVIESLETNILSCTGIPALDAITPTLDMYSEHDENVTAIQFSQLLIAWRFLEQLNDRLRKIQKSHFPS